MHTQKYDFKIHKILLKNNDLFVKHSLNLPPGVTRDCRRIWGLCLLKDKIYCLNIATYE